MKYSNIFTPVEHLLLFQTLKQSGIRGIYRGLGVTIARDCPAIACYFASYDLMVRLLTDDSKPESLSFAGVLLAGGEFRFD